MIRRVGVAAVVAAVAACSSGTPGDGWVTVGSGSTGSAHGIAGSDAVTPVITGWEPACVKAFAAARAAPPADRFAILARACPACGADWRPILLASKLSEHGTSAAVRLEVDKTVRACGGACSGTARDQFLASFDKIHGVRTLDRPWRKLDQACPGVLAPSPEGRFASAPWFVLTHIGRVVGAPGAVDVAEPIDLPLPAAMSSGGGVELPEALHVHDDIAAAYVTVLASTVHVALAPRVALGGTDGISLHADSYPGAAVTLTALGAAIQQTAPDPETKVGVLAPHAAPASRVREVVAAIGVGPALHLAAFGPEPDEGWPDIPRLMPPRLTAVISPGDHLVIALGDGGLEGPGTGGTLADKTVRDACTGDLSDLMKRFQPAAGSEVVIAIGPDLVVDDLAAVIDALAGAGVTTASLVAADAVTWPSGSPPCQ